MSNIKIGLIGFVSENLYTFYKEDICCSDGSVWMPNYLGRHWPSYMEMVRREQLDYVMERALREVENAIEHHVTHLALASTSLDWMIDDIKAAAPDIPIITVADALLHWIRQYHPSQQNWALVEMNEFLMSKVFWDTLTKSDYMFYLPPDLREQEFLITRASQIGHGALDDLISIEKSSGPAHGVILGCSFVNTEYNDIYDHMDILLEHLKALHYKEADKYPCRRMELIHLHYLSLCCSGEVKF